MKLLHCLVAGLLSASAALHAGELPRALPAPPALAKAAAKEPKKERERVQFEFSLLPKSFQANPSMEFTVVTDVTEDGKKLPPVSPDQPAYYMLQPSGFHQAWGGADFRTTLTGDELMAGLVQSLSGNGYLPAAAGSRRPSLLIIYTWGTYFNPEPSPGIPDPIEEAMRSPRDFLKRALLVGGEKFAREMYDAMEKTSEFTTGASSGGIIPDDLLAGANPLQQYMIKDPKNNFLVDQSVGDMYYVVASAYDYAAAAANQRRLLWRTRMTVNAYGLNQSQTFPTVIAAASPFFGKDMSEPEILLQRPREGKVEVGAPRVVHDQPVPLNPDQPALSPNRPEAKPASLPELLIPSVNPPRRP